MVPLVLCSHCGLVLLGSMDGDPSAGAKKLSTCSRFTGGNSNNAIQMEDPMNFDQAKTSP